jgi:hypothetical protein
MLWNANVCLTPRGVTARQRLRHRERVSSPDADGWQEVLHRQATQPAPNSSVPPGSARGGRSASHRPLRHIPADLYGKCFNCLSSAHRVATYKLPQRCLRCKGLQHVARDCKQPRRMGFQSSFDRAPSSLGTVSAPDGRPRRASESLPRVTGFVSTAALRARMVLRRARLLPCLVRPQLCVARL